MEIVTGEQMRRIDRRAIEEVGIPSLQLMEAAGRGVADALLADWPEAREARVVVLCGKGNNGGDGLVAARRLVELGLRPQVFLAARAEELAGDAAVNLQAARDGGVELREIAGSGGREALDRCLERRPIVLDALLGTGVRGGARGPIAELIERLNDSGARVASIDLPSGIEADAAQVAGVAVRAERTYTLCRPKLALVFDPAARLAGRWRVVPIGIPDAAVAAEGITLEWIDDAAAARLLPRREPDSHKGSFGHLLAVAGSAGKSGAAVLLARGALRSGVGLVTVATTPAARGLVAVQQAELMTEALPEGPDGGLARGAGPAALALAAGRDALALGPGLGSAQATRQAIREILAGCALPAVVDADGLNAFAPLETPRDARLRAPGAAPRLLTPHPGEAARLLGETTAAVQADRRAAALELARRSGAVVVLKGHRSLCASPDGRIAVNSSGNPGMATAGSGDVLTGVLGALLARGLAAWDAARLGTYVHGVAGDRAAAERGEEGMIATDLAQGLPAALAALGPARRS